MRRSSITYALAASLTASAAANAQAVKPVWPDEGQFKWAPRPTVTDITANDLRTRLYQFADDSMSGRRIGEPGNYKGTDYIAREFKRLGLKPAGDSGTYFQDLAFGPMGYDSTSAKLVAGTASLGAKTYWIPIAPTAANGYAAKVELANVATVFAGRWGDSTALDASVLKGKIAVFISNAAAVGLVPPRPATLPRCDSVPDKFGAAAAAKVEQAVRDAAAAAGGAGAARAGGAGGRGGAAGVRDPRAAQGGAAGILIIGLDSAAAALVNAPFSGRMTMQPAQPFAGTMSAAVISRSAATTIFGKPVEQLTLGLAGLPVSESWNYEWKISKTPGRNVIAMLPGSDPARAGEFVVVGAHNDHVGTNPTAVDHDSLRAVNYVTRKQGSNDPSCRPTEAQQHQIDSLIARAHKIRPVRRDSIMNGADDDGSGTVVLLEIAEKFAKEKPARSILFVSHEGEEAGLLGSKWFVDHPTVPLKSIVAVHNMDMLGKGRTDQVKFGGPASVQTLGARRLSREFGDMIDSVNATRTEVMAIDKTWDVVANPMNRFCRSDQVNYVNKEIPVTYFSLGYALDYHQPTDEPQYIEYDHTARLARFIHDVMSAIANRKDRLAITGPDVPYPSCGR